MLMPKASAKAPATRGSAPPASRSSRPIGIRQAETQAVVTGGTARPNSISTSRPATCEGPSIAPMPTATEAARPKPRSSVSMCTAMAETTKPCSEKASASSRKARRRDAPAR